MDAELLRWMLSDGAGAVVLKGEPRPAGPSLRVDWVHLASYAHEHPTCMYAGTGEPRSPDAGGTWLDQPTIAAAEAAGLLRLRQDTRALPRLVDLLGAMFVIEGLGTAKALRWAELLQARLGLADDQVRFLRYHGANDADHFELLRQVLRSPVVDRPAAERIVKTARVVARLYALQLEEIDHA